MGDLGQNLIASLLLGAEKDALSESPFNPFKSAADLVGGTLIAGAPQFGVKDSLIAGLLTGLVGGGADYLSRGYANDQVGMLNDLVKQEGVTTKPAGLQDSIWNKANAVRSIFDLEKDNENKQSVFEALSRANNPQQRRAIAQAAKSLGLIEGDLFSETAPAEPIATPARPARDLFPGGPPSIKSKFDETFRGFVDQGATPNAAVDAATTLTAAERKAMTGSVDLVAEARKQAAALNDLALTAEAGVQGAGETGGLFGGPRNFLSKLAASTYSTDQAQKQTSQAILDSVKPDIIKTARAPGAGAMSDREMFSYLEAGPSSAKTPEQNAALIEKMKVVAGYQQEYADFLDAYREEKGTTQGADRLWQIYKQANPLFAQREDGRLVPNAQRPSWQDFFLQAQGAEMPVHDPTNNVIGAGAQPPARGYTAADAAAAGYSPAEIEALRAQGLVQ